jgi:hypothetical protein
MEHLNERTGSTAFVFGECSWGVAQLAERLAVNQEVAGSSPAAPVRSLIALLVAAILALSASDAHAQVPRPEPNEAVLIGTVFDSVSTEPLQGAAIYVIDSDFAAVSDSLGMFWMGPLPRGLYRVSFYHGNLSDRGARRPPVYLVDLTDGGIVQVDLSIPTEEALARLQQSGSDRIAPIRLEGIQVMASRDVDERLAEGGLIRVIDRSTIASFEVHARHVGDVLNEVPSLRVQDLGGILCVTSRRTASRTPAGASRCSGQVAVVVDGVPIAEPETYLPGLRPQMIERVEFLSSVVAGSRYGRNSANGVLLIDTRRPR